MEDERMSRDVDCAVFEDQLDALVKGSLSHEARRLLVLHAGGCPACDMQLRVQRHLAGVSLGELEARVPEAVLAGMWDRVAGELKRGPAGRRGRGWLVPILAAASLLLLFSSGFLYSELGRAQHREAILSQQVEEQQRWLAELEVSPTADPVARTAALAGRNPWLRALSRQESITVEDLRGLLERMPGDRTVMTEGQLDAALRSRFPLSPSFLGEVLARMDRGRPGRNGGGGGVRAGELLQALDGMDLSPDRSVPTSELMDLLS